MSLLFNMLSRLVIAFLPRSKCLNFVNICSDFGAQENKVCHYFHCSTIYLPRSDGTGCHDLSFLNVGFKPAFSLSSSILIKRPFSSSSLSAGSVVYVSKFINISPGKLHCNLCFIKPSISHDVLCM